MYIEKDELLRLIAEKYGDLTNDSGSYAQTNNGYEWLSVKAIVDIINDCIEYEEAY